MGALLERIASSRGVERPALCLHLDVLARLGGLGPKVEELFELRVTTAQALTSVEKRPRAIEDRMLRLASVGEQTMLETRAAAGAASTVVAGAIVSEIVTRVTRLEMRTDAVSRRLLPP
jgi:hypothetical protein